MCVRHVCVACVSVCVCVGGGGDSNAVCTIDCSHGDKGEGQEASQELLQVGCEGDELIRSHGDQVFQVQTKRVELPISYCYHRVCIFIAGEEGGKRLISKRVSRAPS